jgi:hypothetical protein
MSLSQTGKDFGDVRRVGATGTGDTNLTGDVGGWALAEGWR